MSGIEQTPQFSLHHVGWITWDIDLFESFWCKVLGFRQIADSHIDRNRFMQMFAIDSDGYMKRYERHGVVIEVHYFPAETIGAAQDFNTFGINHICLLVPNKDEFLAAMPDDVQKVIYHNVGGWKNVLVRDYEGNWIELYETI